MLKSSTIKDIHYSGMLIMNFIHIILYIIMYNIISSSYAEEIATIRSASPHIITVFVEPETRMPRDKKIHAKLAKPGIINRTLLKHQLQLSRNKGYMPHTQVLSLILIIMAK